MKSELPYIFTLFETMIKVAKLVHEPKGPFTLLRIVLAYASVRKISLIRRYTLTYARGTLDIGCIRFKYGYIRWHTLAHGEAEYFLSMLKNFLRTRTIWFIR
jgi:hypothetical protein